MVLTGLWHGASWTFVIWGLWHGVLLSIERLVNIRPQNRLAVFISTIVTFHLVALGWVLFRAPSLESAMRFIAGLITFNQLHWWTAFIPPVLFVGVMILILDGIKSARLRVPESFSPAIVTAMLVVIICLTLLSVARGNDTQPFIYGRF